jgi:hypothetical protein
MVFYYLMVIIWLVSILPKPGSPASDAQIKAYVIWCWNDRYG